MTQWQPEGDAAPHIDAKGSQLRKGLTASFLHPPSSIRDIEWVDGNGVCQLVNYTCDQFRVPGAGELYEAARPTRTSDRICRPKTVFLTWA